MAKKNPNNYCEFVADLSLTNVHRVYHDTQYGFPILNDNEFNNDEHLYNVNNDICNCL